MPKQLRLIPIGLMTLVAVGCVERTISITSNPPGALVYLNDKEVGRTPVTTPFMWYGTYDVRLEAEGYRPLWTKAKADQPIWDLPGLDLVAEMIPDGKSEIKWHFDLEPAGTVDREQLILRAKDLRHELITSNEQTPVSSDHAEPPPAPEEVEADSTSTDS